MKKSAAAVAAAVAVLAMATLSGVALAGDHHGDHGPQKSSSDSQAGVKPSNTTDKNTSCTTGGGQGASATCQSDKSPKSDASKRYGNGKTAAQIANGKGAPAGTTVTGPGNSQPHKICGRDVHAYKGGDCSKQKPPKPPKGQPESQQQVTFCDMDSATTGKLETKSSVDLLNHEFDGNPEEARDIVPAFTFSGPTFTTKDGRTYVAGQSYSQLWDANGQAIFNAGCNLVPAAATAPPIAPAAATPPPAAPAAATPAPTPAASAPAPAASAPVASAAPSAVSGVLGASKTLNAPAAASSHANGAVLGTLKTLGSTATSGTLPFTGLRLWIVELIALGLIGAGVAMRMLARRQTN